MNIKIIAKIKDVIIGYVFGPETDITIGREIGNTIAPIIDSISRHHAHIFFKDDGWKVEDLGSTNGSLLNGNKIEGALSLKTGDTLRFGLIDMSVTLEQAELPAVTAAEPPPAPAPLSAPETPAAPAVEPPKPAPTPVIEPPKSAPAPVIEPPKPAPTPVVEPPKPAPTPALEPIAPLEPVAELEPLTPLEPLEPLTPLDPITPLEPVAPLEPTSPTSTSVNVQKTALKLPTPGAIRKPVIGGMKPGVKLPTKPSLPSGLKLPPKPGIKPGIKLPPRKA